MTLEKLDKKLIMLILEHKYFRAYEILEGIIQK